MSKEEKCDDSILYIFNWHYKEVPLSNLKKWVDCQLSLGKEFVKLNVEWGYYHDIDSLELEAYKKQNDE